MNKKFVKLLSLCLFGIICFVCFTSCERYPVRALLGINDPIDSWPETWYIYDDEINTKGSLEPFKWEAYTGCADWEKVKLDFACLDNPKRGRHCMQLTWIGNSQDPDSGYFGFGLMATEYKGGIINMSKSEYTNLKFWIRGTLYTNCSFKIEIPKKGGGTPWISRSLTASEITSEWQPVEIQIPNIEDMSEIEYDISISLIADGVTNGGTIYMDDIRFTRD